jgi:hypothetical protein
VIASFRSTMNKVARGKGKHLHYRLKIELKGTFILACGDLQLHWRSPILPYLLSRLHKEDLSSRRTPMRLLE